MKYKVKSEVVSSKVQEVEVDLPLRVKDDKLTDQMVRSQAKSFPEALVKLEDGERIVEVWRGETRVYPRAAKKAKASKPAEPVKPVGPKDWVHTEI